MDADGVRNGRRQILTDLSTTDAEALLRKSDRLAPDVRLYLPAYSFLFIISGALLVWLLQSQPRKVLGITIVSVVLGWCAFDYNTHGNFGRGSSTRYPRRLSMH